MFAGNKAKYLLLSAFVLFGGCRTVHAADPAQELQRFKLGFEFQESSHLCPWAQAQTELQKKPIFYVRKQYDGGEPQKLWHLVIDGSDIEFVTEPFCSDDPRLQAKLKDCMESITEALRLLKSDFDDMAIGIADSKEEWGAQLRSAQTDMAILETGLKATSLEKNKLEEVLEESEKDHYFLLSWQTAWEKERNTGSMHSENWEQLLQETEERKRAADLKKKENEKKIAETISQMTGLQQKLEIVTEDIRKIEQALFEKSSSAGWQTIGAWAQSLMNYLRNRNSSWDFLLESAYEEGRLMLPEKHLSVTGWKPLVAPQITVQHALSIAVPLYFSLFFHNSPKAKHDHKPAFLAALPDADQLIDHRKDKQINEKLQTLATPLGGLLFLHALTMTCLCKSVKENALRARTFIGELIENEATDERAALQSILKDYIESRQIDAKMHLPLMSRRSFSDMWQDVNAKENWRDAYERCLISGNRRFRNTKELFKDVNYGVQILGEGGKGRDLTVFSHFLKATYLEKHNDIIKTLLKKGIICTSMLRNCQNPTSGKDSFNPDILKHYFEHAVCSVDKPANRYTLNVTVTGIDPQSQDEMTAWKTEAVLAIKTEKTKHDALSPPWFLEEQDSMGRLSRDEDQCKDYEHAYGEAVIEIRDVRSIKLENENWKFFEAYDHIEQDAAFFLLYLQQFHVFSKTKILEMTYEKIGNTTPFNMAT